jgi:hypothetical protein
MDFRKQYGGHHWSHFRYRQVTPLAFSQQSANIVVSGRRISEGENAAFTTGRTLSSTAA